MEEYAGELPRKFINLHWLEKESNNKSGSSTEAVESFPNIPRASESETVTVAETETFPIKSLALLHVAVVGECVANDVVDVVAKGVSVASQE